MSYHAALSTRCTTSTASATCVRALPKAPRRPDAGPARRHHRPRGAAAQQPRTAAAAGHQADHTCQQYAERRHRPDRPLDLRQPPAEPPSLSGGRRRVCRVSLQDTDPRLPLLDDRDRHAGGCKGDELWHFRVSIATDQNPAKARARFTDSGDIARGNRPGGGEPRRL